MKFDAISVILASENYKFHQNLDFVLGCVKSQQLINLYDDVSANIQSWKQIFQTKNYRSNFSLNTKFQINCWNWYDFDCFEQRNTIFFLGSITHADEQKRIRSEATARLRSAMVAKKYNYFRNLILFQKDWSKIRKKIKFASYTRRNRSKSLINMKIFKLFENLKISI